MRTIITNDRNINIDNERIDNRNIIETIETDRIPSCSTISREGGDA